ncbi:Two component system response regulator/histidine kinase [Desulfonema limicola]|uniref:histidine kinase n=1 Tax=Desulfonema limicola TaxID=45656 RepID=A0A975B377_9BACT|nr:hybrid sensor histidine kinase/response regulator [Desulfonema limicola]QTA77960.1 Two component system response regulator/histidine kinase [Desulfonema limicola]
MKTDKGIILIVDDNPNNLMMLIDVLDESNYELRIAKDGQSALNIVQKESIDLILLDVMMPGMNGFEVCSRLKGDSRTREIPIIFMTALSETINKIRGFELGAVDYIIKPIQIEEVMSRVKTHIKLSRLLKKENEINSLKSKIISLASHDLTIPLHTISASSSFLRLYNSRLSDKEKMSNLSIIDEAVKKMSITLDNIITWFESESGQTCFSPELINISNFCKDIFEKFKLLVKDSHKMEFSCVKSDIQVFIDPDLMRNAVINILSNAFAYSPKESLIKFDVFIENKEIAIKITDQGRGIAPKEQEKIFQPYFASKNSGTKEGRGLGLYTAKYFVQLHNGRINLESKTGRGSVFTIYLPSNQ